MQVERGMQELVLQYEAKVGRLESQQRERLARPEKVFIHRTSLAPNGALYSIPSVLLYHHVSSTG